MSQTKRALDESFEHVDLLSLENPHSMNFERAARSIGFLSFLILHGNVWTLCFRKGTAKLAGMTLALVAAARNTNGAASNSKLLPIVFGHNNGMHPTSLRGT